MLNIPADKPLRETLSVVEFGTAGHSRVQYLAAMLDEVDVGLVTIEPESDFATVNGAAAALLSIPAGTTTTSEFAAILDQVAHRAANAEQAVEQLHTVQRDPDAVLRTTWAFAESPTHLGVMSKPAPYAGFHGRIWAFYDNSGLAEAIDATERAAALLRVSSDGMLDPQVVLEAIWRDGQVVDLVYRDVNRATCEYLGVSREQLLDHSLLSSMPDLDGSGLMAHCIRCAQTGEPVILDGFPLHNGFLNDLRYYDIRGSQVRPGWMTLTWRDVTERWQLNERIALSEQRFRLLAENMADVIVRIVDDRITWVSNSVEQALAAPPENWIGRSVTDFVPAEYHDTYRTEIAEVIRGRTLIGRYRVTAADGAPHWIHVHAKPFREADGTPNGVVVSFRVIDEEVAVETSAQEQIGLRDAQNLKLNRRLQSQTDRLVAELKSAASYVASILPDDLDGPVRVSSRFVPSLELGGDSYDYRWLDDDHLMVYLLDVSGHGVGSAMLSVSVHNLLRSGTLSLQKLLQPAVVLNELNRLFQMDRHDGNYFTIWYGIYQLSTRRLRYASAGHPPALALAPDTEGSMTATPLTAAGLPIGTFEDAQFAAGTYTVPRNAEIVVYSDGAFELDLGAGQWDQRDFTELCTRLSSSPDWSVDTLVAELAAQTRTGILEDDCTIVRMVFD